MRIRAKEVVNKEQSYFIPETAIINKSINKIAEEIKSQKTYDFSKLEDCFDLEATSFNFDLCVFKTSEIIELKRRLLSLKYVLPDYSRVVLEGVIDKLTQ